MFFYASRFRLGNVSRSTRPLALAARIDGGLGQGRECDLCQQNPTVDAAGTGVVEAILDGRQTAEMQLDDLLRGLPLEWAVQREHVVP